MTRCVLYMWCMNNIYHCSELDVVCLGVMDCGVVFYMWSCDYAMISLLSNSVSIELFTL